ncbi:MAG: SDR family NAD(P)-dependent oxidoreductase [Myxococcota bacterium]|nr:SDR family NAD(P)-dependent oxidoreductase [Myxococcota bacterium]
MARLSRLSRSIEGRVALVTGAASGMGRATAHLFADEGARVAVVDRHADGVDRVVDEIQEAGGEAQGFVADIGQLEATGEVVDAVVKGLGALDILVNNAGITLPAPIDAEDYEGSWSQIMDVNLTAHVRLVRAALPHLENSDAARVVNIASTEGMGAQPYVSAYTASKHGVIGLTRAMAVELGKRGINFNCVCPGPIDTGMTSPIPQAAKEKFARRRVPLQRYGDPEEVAHATLSLVLPASSYINGAVLMCDGGLSIQNN